MRVFSVYGTYDRDNSMIMSTIRNLMNGDYCQFTPAEQLWDYLYEDDIGEAFYLVGKYVVGSHTYCVGSGKVSPIKDYIKLIRDIVNPLAPLGIGELSYPKNPVMYLCADISDLRRDTGWVPKTDFREGIQRIYRYIKNTE